jgi:hypothetical protein
MAIENVTELEAALGQPLPADYRDFLSGHLAKYLEPSLLVRHMVDVPGSGPEDVVSALYTAADILESDLLGEPNEKMVIIGLVEPGGYLYMCFAPNDFGGVYVRFPYQDSRFYPVGHSFSAFLSRCRPEPESDA